MPPKRKNAAVKKSAEEVVENVKSDSGSQSNKKLKKNGQRFNLVSMNVNGIRAFAKKPDAKTFLLSDLVQNCDVLCIQETKCEDEDLLDKTFHNLFGAGKTWLYLSKSTVKGNYGVLTVCRREPLKVDYEDFMDTEGRIITVHYDQFILVNVYVPNSGMGLKRLDYRMKWDISFRQYLSDLVKINPNVIVTGDLNCSHKEIDLANPKTNVKNAGFTPQERASFTEHLESGLIDSFRELYPDKTGAYTFWSMRSASARPNNVGWRLDYFLLSPALKSSLVDSQIHPDFKGSDHCPISVTLDI